jgi:protein TonB
MGIDGYPQEAKNNGQEGITRLRFTVNEQGLLVVAEITRSAGASVLDETALSALSKCKFRPAQRNDGSWIRGEVEIEFVWSL